MLFSGHRVYLKHDQVKLCDVCYECAANEIDDLGDTSTLADPSVVDHLVENRSV